MSKTRITISTVIVVVLAIVALVMYVRVNSRKIIMELLAPPLDGLPLIRVQGLSQRGYRRCVLSARLSVEGEPAARGHADRQGGSEGRRAKPREGHSIDLTVSEPEKEIFTIDVGERKRHLTSLLIAMDCNLPGPPSEVKLWLSATDSGEYGKSDGSTTFAPVTLRLIGVQPTSSWWWARGELEHDYLDNDILEVATLTGLVTDGSYSLKIFVHFLK